MKSKTKTAAMGVAAACAAATSAAAPLLSSSPAAAVAAAPSSNGLHHPGTSSPSVAEKTAPVRIVPRGGGGHNSSPQPTTTSSSSTTTTDGEKRRRKKKKSSKNQPSKTKTAADSVEGHHHQKGDSDSSSSSSRSPELPPAARSILEQGCHYDVLGITKSSTSVEIKKAYRRRCVLTHPDKTGGDRSAFDRVSEAYDVLGCERKRAAYDRFGKGGMAEGGRTQDVDAAMRGFGTGGNSFFGSTDAFREFFGAAGVDPFLGRRASPQSSHFRRAPSNRDLRYQLEVTLEELYGGTTKRVAIQQPDPLRPHFTFRKEVEVTLPPGTSEGGSVRLSGVVDSVPDAPPADVIFLIRERRHAVYTRRGSDLAMEVKISFAESVVGFRRNLKCLEGVEIAIGSPFVRRVVQKEEMVDVPALPSQEGAVDVATASDAVNGKGNYTNDTAVKEDVVNVTVNESNTSNIAKAEETPAPPETMTKTTTISYRLPPSIIRTGDVHVLKGRGMPKRRNGHNHEREYGDLYVQYTVEMPGGASSSSSKAGGGTVNDANNLSPEEAVDLARLLSKLEGGEDPTKDVVSTSDDECSSTSLDQTKGQEKDDKIHHLSMASASDFGRSVESDDTHHDEHLHHHHDDDMGARNMPHHGDVGDFFQRAFAGRARAGPFGGTGGGGRGFHYFSSGGSAGGAGFGYGGRQRGEEEDHKVECNQM